MDRRTGIGGGPDFPNVQNFASHFLLQSDLKKSKSATFTYERVPCLPLWSKLIYFFAAKFVNFFAADQIFSVPTFGKCAVWRPPLQSTPKYNKTIHFFMISIGNFQSTPKYNKTIHFFMISIGNFPKRKRKVGAHQIQGNRVWLPLIRRWHVVHLFLICF